MTILPSNTQSIVSLSENSFPISISTGVPPRLLPNLGDKLMPAEKEKKKQENYIGTMKYLVKSR